MNGFLNFFINRPKFAIVLALVLTIVGGLSLAAIPVAQYPEIAPPEIVVNASYPGASAETVVDSLAAPIEAQVNGVEDMLYMSSTSSNNGRYTLTITFAVGTDPDLAAINVQNRIALATPTLPEAVRALGVTVRERSASTLMYVQLVAKGGEQDQIALSNLMAAQVRDPIARLAGVGDATILGESDYAMRVWLMPDRMHALSVTAADVMSALRAQNVQASAGQLGGAPTPALSERQLTIQARGRLRNAAEFGDVIVRTNQDGAIVRLRDIARLELGARSYEAITTLGDKPAASLAIYQAPGSNALEVARLVRAELERIQQTLPGDVEIIVSYDFTEFVAATIEEIEVTLAITVVIVLVVIFVFLQTWRATLIPLMAIPVSLVATFAVLLAAGMSANSISLFAIILAITLVVDDAIVVVENVRRVMEEGPDIDPKSAVLTATAQVAGPVIATTLVLCAIFGPVAFLSGMTGELYRQFAVTICVSVVLSGIVALTLTPALCAVLLARTPNARPVKALRAVEPALDKIRDRYVRLVSRGVGRLGVGLALAAAFAAVALILSQVLPTSLLPEEDQGVVIMHVQLPDGASLSRTDAVVRGVVAQAERIEGVEHVLAFSGVSVLNGATAPNAAGIIVVLEPWARRRSHDRALGAIMAQLQRIAANEPAAFILAINPPAIPGIGLAGGFEAQLTGLNGQGASAMAQAARGFVQGANATPPLSGVYTTFTAETPQLLLDLDRRRAEILGVSPAEVFTTLQAHLGAAYVNDFNIGARTYQVRVQNDAPYRQAIEDIERLYVRAQSGALVPLRSVVTVRDILGPDVITRFNQSPSVRVSGAAAPGASSGQALDAIESLAQQTLPEGFAIAWSGVSFQERAAGAQALVAIILSIVFGYLFLVALYESWSIPLAVMASLSTAMLGALVALFVTGRPIDLYAQLGLILMLGLAAKNAILIIEFARDARAEGRTIEEAAQSAARARFRPVLMTAAAFVFGVLPLVFAEGAGGESRRSMGVTVFGGMIGAGTLGLLVIPILYVALQRLRESVKARAAAALKRTSLASGA